MMGLSGAGLEPTPGNMNSVYHTELSSLEGTRCQFNGGTEPIKIGIDVHQDFYVVVCQVAALGIECHVVCPQKLDEQNRRVKTDGLDAKALCLKLDRFVQGNRDALAVVRVPGEEEERARALHRQREQLVQVRKQLEAQGRSLLLNHGCAPVQQWWKKRAFAQLDVPHWIKELLANNQPILFALQEKIDQLTLHLQNAAIAEPPRGLGKMASVIIDREIGDWRRFNNRRQI